MSFDPLSFAGKTTDQNTIKTFPDEILVHIFSSLDALKSLVSIRAVCKKWRQLILHENFEVKFKPNIIARNVKNRCPKQIYYIPNSGRDPVAPEKVIHIKNKKMTVLYENHHLVTWDIPSSEIISVHVLDKNRLNWFRVFDYYTIIMTNDFFIKIYKEDLRLCKEYDIRKWNIDLSQLNDKNVFIFNNQLTFVTENLGVLQIDLATNQQDLILKNISIERYSIIQNYLIFQDSDNYLSIWNLHINNFLLHKRLIKSYEPIEDHKKAFVILFDSINVILLDLMGSTERVIDIPFNTLFPYYDSFSKSIVQLESNVHSYVKPPCIEDMIGKTVVRNTDLIVYDIFKNTSQTFRFESNKQISSLKQIEIHGNFVFSAGLRGVSISDSIFSTCNSNVIWEKKSYVLDKSCNKNSYFLQKVAEFNAKWSLQNGKYYRFINESTMLPGIEIVDYFSINTLENTTLFKNSSSCPIS